VNAPATEKQSQRWLNRTVFGIGLASLFSDWSHEIATTILPAFLASMGAAAAWLGLIEGVSDGLSSFAKMASGYYTDKLQRRKPIAIVGYLVTALGTASIGLATAAWQILLSRAGAWLGRGVRTPVRKALLAAAVTRETYGRAFGFERMMDTIGAIVGPATAFVLLAALQHNYRHIFLLTLIPGVCAAGVITFFVREKERKPVSHISFGERLRLLPRPYRKFLVAVGIFGAGDFAPTLLIWLATQKLAPELGAARAASVAVGFYVLRNIFYAGFAYVAGWLADRFKKQFVLAFGYALAAVMALLIVAAPMTIGLLGIIFVLSGIHVAIGETLEDSFCAELVGEEHHGMAFGVLATVNGVGDFLSSIIVGVLWTAFGTTAAFGYSAVLFTLGALLVLRIQPAKRLN
jgi:MFS family permease